MSPAATVLYDLEDDIAVVREIRARAAREPHSLVVAIAPDAHTARGVIWAILRALGKRIEHLDRTSLTWGDAERWMAAHEICELTVLRAHHMTPATETALATTTHGAGATLVLIRNTRTSRPRTTALKPLPHDAPPSPPVEWPNVPRVSALQLRWACLRTLGPDEFRQVDELIQSAVADATWWLSCSARTTPAAVAQMASVLTTASGPEHGYIRRCALEIALLDAGLPAGLPRRFRRGAASPTTEADVVDAHGHTDPVAACLRLAAAVTGLPQTELALIGGDQITATSILNIQIPKSARSILRALKPQSGAVFRRVRAHVLAPDRSSDYAAGDPSAQVMSDLLESASARVQIESLPPVVRDEMRRFVDDGDIDLRGGNYRPSAAALFGTYRTKGPPTRFTATSTRRSTATP